MTPPDLSDEQVAELIARFRGTASSQRKHAEGWHRRSAHSEAFNAEGIADKFDSAASAIEQMALRVRALEQERQEWLRNHRWNIREDGDTLIVCHGDHEKYEACTETRYVPEYRAEASAKDAARYRWLRDNWNHKPARLHTGGGRLVWDSGREQFDTFDEAVDAAKEQPHG